MNRSLCVTIRKLGSEEGLHKANVKFSLEQQLDCGVLGRLLAAHRRLIKNVLF